MFSFGRRPLRAERDQPAAPPESPDDALTPADIARAVDGDPAATRRLLRSLWPTLVGLTRRIRLRYNAPEDLEDDLVQEVWVALFANPHTALLRWDPQKNRSLKNYLAVFAQRRIIDALRRRGREIAMADDALLERLDSSGGRADDGQLQLEVLDTLYENYRQRVTEEQWRFFVAWLDGASTEALAAQFRLSPDAVFQRVRRMRVELRAVLVPEVP